jgi:3-methylfumaryl-CoA hydratase
LDIGDWVGRSETVSYEIESVPYAAVSALLTSPARWPAPGTPLPALWHWLYRMPLRQALLPAVSHARWSWVGCRIRVHATVCIGDAVTRRSSVLPLTQDAGDTPPLARLTLRHVISRIGDARAAITEDHDIVLGDVQWSRGSQPLQNSTELSRQRRWDPDEFRTFRHAALAFGNARDHTAGSHAIQVPECHNPIAEGPLVAMLLQDFLHHNCPESTLVAFRARTVLPLHDFVPFFLHIRPGRGPSTTEFWAEDHRGRLAMAARAIVR